MFGLPRWLLTVVVIVIIAAGAFLLRDRLSSGAGDLQVGDCFDSPTVVGETVSEVQHHPCSEGHTGEVFAVVTDPAASDAAYPDQVAQESFVATACAAPFLDFVGIAMDQSALDVRYFTPTSDGWASGDRGYTCYVQVDEGTTTSVRNSKR